MLSGCYPSIAAAEVMADKRRLLGKAHVAIVDAALIVDIGLGPSGNVPQLGGVTDSLAGRCAEAQEDATILLPHLAFQNLKLVDHTTVQCVAAQRQRALDAGD